MKGALNTISRWFGLGGKQAAAPQPAHRSGPPETQQPPERAEPADAAAPFDVVACLVTDVGCHREVNEDNVRYIHPADADRLAEKGSLVIVADGMGGHAAGEVASRMAVEVIARAYYESDRPASEALHDSFREANRAIYEAAQTETRQGMGTTATALALRGGVALYAHVGDSRLYLVRDDGIYQMSEDHSLVGEMVRQGMLTQEEARHHDDKNVILRALGTKPEVDVTTWPSPFRVGPGDRFVLCSDGLYDLVEDHEILDAVASAPPHEACETLIALAKERGGHDNITIGLIALVDADEAPGEQTDRPTRDVEALTDPDDRPTREARTLDE